MDIKNNKKGFTLIELLSALVILGIIATIAVQAYNVLIVKNDESKYKYYWDLVEKAVDLYFDAKKTTMVSGECLSVNYQTLVDKNYLKEDGITCSGNIILRKDGKKYVYDDTNIECKSNDKVVKEKGSVEAVCKDALTFTFDDNYDREKNIAQTMTTNDDNWKNINTTHIVKSSYNLASAKQFAFTVCSGECGVYQNLTNSLIADKTYRWSVKIKASSGKNLKVGVGTTGLKQVVTTGSWQSLSGEFDAADADTVDSTFKIINTNSWLGTGDDLYVNSVIVYEVDKSLKNKMAFPVGEKFGDGLPVPQRKGWDFVGWYTEPIGGQKIDENTIVPNTKNIIYYAHWSKKSVKVSYLPNGGSGSMSASTISYGSDYTIKSNVFTRTGYTFNYWSNKDNWENFNIWPSTPITWNYDEDISLSAMWRVNQYTIKYNANGGSGSMVSSNHKYSQGKALTANAFTKTGYTFSSWNTASDGSGDGYANKEYVRNLTTVDGATINLYAQWTANTYTVKYNGNNATSGSTASSSHTYGVEKELRANGFKRSGYVFDGWNTKANGTGDSYADKQSVKDLTATNGGTVNLYAQWESSEFTVTFDPNGGSVSPTSKQVTNDSTYESLPTPTRTGYKFNGWYTAKTGGSKITNESTVNLTADQTLYAQWTVNSYTVTLSKGEGISSVSGAGTYKYGESVTINLTLASNSVWINWTGYKKTTTQKYTFTMPAKAVSFTANAHQHTGKSGQTYSNGCYTTKEKNGGSCGGHPYGVWHCGNCGTVISYNGAQCSNRACANNSNPQANGWFEQQGVTKHDTSSGCDKWTWKYVYVLGCGYE